MNDIKSYKVYQLDQTPKGEYSPSLEKQLKRVREHFKRIYNIEPQELLIGPIKVGEQVLVPNGQVYIPIPEQISVAVGGYAFVTGYDTEDPSRKT